MAKPAAVGSLHRRLSLSLGGLALLVGFLGAFGAWIVVHQLASEFNEDLRQAAAAIRPAPPVMPAPSRGKAAPAPPPVLVQTWGPEDGVRPGHTNAPWVMLPRAQPGFSDVEAHGAVWDVFALQAGDAYVQIAQQRSVRQANAWRVATWAAIPVIVLLPVLVWAIRVGVREALRPLSVIGERVAQADLNHLEPVDTSTAPEELRPFLESVNRMMVRLSGLIHTERTFIANAAHELRSPLTALQLQVENLVHAPRDNVDEQLEELRRGIRRTGALITRLLELARAEIGTPRAPDNVAVADVVTDVVTDLLPLAVDRGVDLGVERLDNVQLAATETDLRMLIKNLVDNAIRYGGRGGRVDLSVRRDGGDVVIEVADTGPGIPEAARTRVFERFYRGGATDEEGSGLGLAIVQTIAGNLGGRIDLKGRADGRTGLVARVVLPLRTRSAA
ncbi:HAMP domain-containing histidine kinase [Cupriavidus gilardii]|uniref:sensor histidine kinase n=1 Tax=Cupriavidus gilardii TaxID=82541 RepID=UPI001ABE00EB|nr:HAMP domain-containing sensor histidine kinase [Cupriavidus gilardii]MBO4123141.1 HAMP domain-containing histidine kinase [Cupriavidus gilardii]